MNDLNQSEYKYDTLSRSLQEIRVLHLHPGHFHDEISCSISRVSLGTNPDFEALSYVWGDPNDTLPVILEGCEVQITKSLEAAIRRLRKEDEERIIWIDQLCINQVDLQEKSRQVAFMPQIYWQCKEVLLLLGEFEFSAVSQDLNDCGLATAGMRIIEEYSTGKHVQEISCFKVINNSLVVPSDHALDLQGLTLIATLPYWDRAWIVQEKILAPKATAILGSCSLPWITFTTAAQEYLKHTTGCCRLLQDTLPFSTRTLLLSLFSKIHRVLNIAAIRNGEGTTIFDLLRYTRSRRATDDRDKVFSILGLVTKRPGNALRIEPDYTLSTLQVYARLAEHVIKSMDGDMMVLTGNHWHRPHLPSWVPDWAAEDTSYPYETGWEAMYSLYNASLNETASPKLHTDSILLLDGYFVDRISVIGDVMEVHDWHNLARILPAWEKLASLDVNPRQLYVAGNDLEDAFWRCMVANHCSDAGLDGDDRPHSKYYKAGVEDFLTYKLWREEIKVAVPGQWTLSGETLGIQMTIPITVRHRKFFITEKGYFGVGPTSTQVDDEAHVLLGSKVPFVTRPYSGTLDVEIRTLEADATKHCLVGECYVHGIMDGEIFSNGGLSKQKLAFC